MSEATAQGTETGSLREKIKLEGARPSIVGVKNGMTQVQSDDGFLLACTVISLENNIITQVKNLAKDGYNGVQLGLSPKKKNVTKSALGHFKNSGEKAFFKVGEIKLPDNAKLDGVQAGKMLAFDLFKSGDLVDISARSKGKGFQGGVKRFHMAGGFKSHGASVNHRQIGSIGNRADPGKCFRNKKMPGQMGNENVTVQNVRVIRFDAERNLLLVNGSVPGAKSGFVTIRKAVKSK